MNKIRPPHDRGLRRLIRQGRELFRIRENTQHYSIEDYREAEKKFIKVCILEGRCGSSQVENDLRPSSRRTHTFTSNLTLKT